MQIQMLRLPAAAWSALLAALAIPPGGASLPGTATIVGRAPDDIYQIEYAGRVASFASPQRLAIGATVHLARAPAETVSAPALPPVPAAAASTQISETLETLSQLLDRAFRDPPRPLALAPGAIATLAEPQRFAATLADAVSGSGVFFESHLAEWVRGKRSLGLVRAEAESRAAAVAPAADMPQRPMTAGAAALQQQLSLLVTSEIAFQFAAWPGQTASLEMGPAPDDGDNEAAPERDFVARLQADMRELGPVHATLSLTSCGIEVALRADSPNTAAAMRNGLASLTSAFIGAGLHISRFEVNHERHD
jgi:hypothetical protein